MTEVLLFYPRTGWDIAGVTTRLPLSLLYIGSYLECRGFSVQIIDQRIDDRWEHSLKRAISPALLWVGISSMTGMQIRNGLKAAQIIRKIDPKLPIVWGGVHPSILPEQVIHHPLADLIVVGEGESTSYELSQLLRQEKKKQDLSKIPGLVWKTAGKIIRNIDRPFISMQDLPALNYDLVDINRYILKEVASERSVQMTTSRGCPRDCGYCYLGSVPHGRRYRAEPPVRTVESIEYLRKSFPIDAIHIIDDDFFVQKKRVQKICELLIQRNIRIRLRTNCRIDTMDRMDEETLALVRRAGFSHLYFGVESGNNRILKFIQKGIDKEQVLRVNMKLAKAGIIPKYSFMGGYPTETLQEIKETLELMVRLVDENPQAQTTPLQLYTPYPGTPLYDLYIEKGIRMPIHLEKWSNWGWEQCQSYWLRPNEKRFLEKAAYFTLFLDGKTVSDSVVLPVLKLLTQLYGHYVRQRIQHDIYWFMPEVSLIKWKLSK